MSTPPSGPPISPFPKPPLVPAFVGEIAVDAAPRPQTLEAAQLLIDQAFHYVRYLEAQIKSNQGE